MPLTMTDFLTGFVRNHQVKPTFAEANEAFQAAGGKGDLSEKVFHDAYRQWSRNDADPVEFKVGPYWETKNLEFLETLVLTHPNATYDEANTAWQAVPGNEMEIKKSLYQIVYKATKRSQP